MDLPKLAVSMYNVGRPTLMFDFFYRHIFAGGTRNIDAVNQVEIRRRTRVQ